MECVVNKKDRPSADRNAATNRRAFHEYAVEDKIEAGIALIGPEVKSIRAHHLTLTDAYAEIRSGEVWLVGVQITPYRAATHIDVNPTRDRKLLLQKGEIQRLERQVRQKGYTLIPLRVYFSPSGYAKVELGLCRGKRQYDKREAIQERDAERRVERAVKEFEKSRQERG